MSTFFNTLAIIFANAKKNEVPKISNKANLSSIILGSKAIITIPKNEIIINTDSDEAIKIAKDLEVSFKKREEYYASSECTNSEFWAHIAEKTDSDLIMFTNCTSPLIKEETYVKIINEFEKSKSNNDSINTVTKIKEYLYQDNKPLNFNPSKAPNSQDLPEIVKLNFAVNILAKQLMFAKKSLIGNKPLLYKLDDVEGFDINTNYEFEFAEHLFKKYNSSI